MDPGGYLWWYLDIVSDDGREALTVILFVGSVFSPFYAAALGKNDGADPEDYCAVNVAVYGVSERRWAFSEYQRPQIERREEQLTLGRSVARWEDGQLVIALDERAASLWSRRRVRGTVRVSFEASPKVSFSIDPDGRHRWWPIAPVARAIVQLDEPNLRFAGSAYLDSNFGEEPLADGFARWHWSRSESDEGKAIVLYDAVPRRGAPYERSLAFESDGSWGYADASLESQPLGRGFWGVDRETRADAGANPRVLRAFEDAPFYTRELIETTIEGRRLQAVHESIDFDRWRKPVVRAMLPFRIRRRFVG